MRLRRVVPAELPERLEDLRNPLAVHRAQNHLAQHRFIGLDARRQPQRARGEVGHFVSPTVLRDAPGTLPRHTGRDVKIKTQWPWSKEPFEFGAEILEETPDKIIFVAKVIDGPASGVPAPPSIGTGQ